MTLFRHKGAPVRSRCLFVYGTLRANQPNLYARYLRVNSSYIAVGKMSGRLFHLSRYPGAVYQAGSQTKVIGEVCRIHSPGILHRLDRYEGITEHDEYYRSMVPVKTKDGMLYCWTWLLRYIKNDYTPIASGDWLSVMSSERK